MEPKLPVVVVVILVAVCLTICTMLTVALCGFGIITAC